MQKKTDDTKLFGAWGEEEAAEYLKKNRYKIIGMNYRIRGGEIDIIAENRGIIAFVEVKTRRSQGFAQAREYVTTVKQKRLLYAAKMWLSQNPTELQPRFDVIEIYAPQGMTGGFQINHLKNAFSEV